MHDAQHLLNERWQAEGKDPFGLGIGLSTGEAAAALLGSEERLEYTLVGDTVNLSQRLQQWAEQGEIVLSEGTWSALPEPRPAASAMEPALVKGRTTPVGGWKVAASAAPAVT
jgi:class 3 adenylate cyclase